jgi:ubiquitin-associated SH3 domain-containing protein
MAAIEVGQVVATTSSGRRPGESVMNVPCGPLDRDRAIRRLAEVSSELIVYATPRGPLAAAVDGYLDAARREAGPNLAHGYPPHCTLTGFFHDEPSSVPTYVAALVAALESVPVADRSVLVVGLEIGPDWHGLTLDAPSLEAVIASFVPLAVSPSRADALRPKTDLHVSLAYGFAEDAAPGLAHLARTTVDPWLDVSWDIGLWERREQAWTCHWRRPFE